MHRENRRECGECRKVRDASDFSVVYDRYGIYYRKVCCACFDAVQDEINDWRFDPADAGESLEGE